MSKVVPIKRFDKKMPLPAYQTKGAAGFDLYAREGAVIKPGEVVLIPLNVAIAIPKGHFILLAARSSLRKIGLTIINGVGIIDSDFQGEEDEFRFAAQNFIKKTVIVEKGTRIAQGVLLKYETAKWKEVSKMKAKTRGGFGSTGQK